MDLVRYIVEAPAGYVAGEFTMLYPNLITAGISYSWGWWSVPSEIDKLLDMANSAPEFYLVLGMRDFTHHITAVRDTYERMKNKGFRIIIVGGSNAGQFPPAGGWQKWLDRITAEQAGDLMYAIGKSVQQDYREAGKWFLTAAEAGNARAATNYVGSLRSGMGNLRTDPELSARWSMFLMAHPEYSPVRGR